jgi:hypothetical protein
MNLPSREPIFVTFSFFSRDHGVRRLATLFLVLGFWVGVVKVWPAFRNLENQRYWAKYVHSWVSAYPGSHLIEGTWGEVLLVAKASASTPPLPPLPKGYTLAEEPASPDELLKQAPDASQQITIRSFGSTSPDPPSLGAYGLLGLVVLAYVAVPFLCPHAIAWVVTGFRAKPPTRL